MKRFIPLAFATLAFPAMALAQTAAPAPEEEKPLVPKVPVPAPEAAVPLTPAAPPVEPPAVKPPAPEPPAAPPVPMPEKPTAPVPPVPEKPDTPATPGAERRGPPGAERRGPPGSERRGPTGSERPGPPAAERPGAPAGELTERPGPPGKKRRGPPGTDAPSGAPANPIPAPPATTPEGKPSTDPERMTPPPGKGKPAPRPDEAPGTPKDNRKKGRPDRGTPPATPETPGTPATPPTTPGTPATPSATPGATGTGMPPATPGTATTPPSSDKPSAGKQPREGDPAKPAAPAPGSPMPPTTPTAEAPGAPKAADRPEGRDRPERPAAQKPPTQETTQVLVDEPKRDRQADAAQARKIDNPNDAKRLLQNILGAAVGAGAAAVGAGPNDRPDPRDPRDRRDGYRPRYRPSVEEVGRTQQDRERTVTTIVERFQGRAPQAAPPGGYPRQQRIFDTVETQRRTRFYEGNRRVIRYSSMQEVPPIIVASQQLNRVQVLPHAQGTYPVRPQTPQQGFYQNDIPPSYTSGGAYAVSYQVDPDSAISTDAILFRQGSTDFSDAYSYDLVIDMANAMMAPALSSATFVIEGHASAEGDYAQNLQLSQERAERISRELVRQGVSAERLMPVGYGEAEASYPAEANETDRRLDRRVVVFRMRQGNAE